MKSAVQDNTGLTTNELDDITSDEEVGALQAVFQDVVVDDVMMMKIEM